MGNIIIYTKADGSKVVICPTPEAIELIGIEAIAEKDAPSGQAWEIADSSIIPSLPKPAPTTDDVNAERDRRIEKGCDVPVTGVDDPIPLQGKPRDQLNILGLQAKANRLVAAGDTTTATIFRDRDNIRHELMPSQLSELCEMGTRYIEAIMQVSWDMKDCTGDFEGGIPSDYANDAYWPSCS